MAFGEAGVQGLWFYCIRFESRTFGVQEGAIDEAGKLRLMQKIGGFPNQIEEGNYG